MCGQHDKAEVVIDQQVADKVISITKNSVPESPSYSALNITLPKLPSAQGAGCVEHTVGLVSSPKAPQSGLESRERLNEEAVEKVLEESRSKLGSLSSLRGKRLSAESYLGDESDSGEVPRGGYFKIPKVSIRRDSLISDVSTKEPRGGLTSQVDELGAMRRELDIVKLKLTERQKPESLHSERLSQARLESLLEAVVSGQATSEDVDFARGCLDRDQGETPDSPELKSKVDFNQQQLDHMKAAINAGIVELRRLLHVQWGDLEQVARPSHHLESLMEDADPEAQSSREELAGLPISQEIREHLTAVWGLKSPGRAKLHEAFRLTPTAYKSFATFPAGPDQSDLDLLGISKSAFDKTLKPRVLQQPLASLATESGRAAAASIRMTGVLASSLDGLKMFHNRAVDASSAAKESLKLMAATVESCVDAVAGEAGPLGQLQDFLTNLLEINAASLQHVRAFHTELGHMETARSLAFSAAFSNADLQGRLAARAARSLREVWAQQLLTDNRSKDAKQLKTPFVDQPFATGKLFPGGVAKGLQTMVRGHELRAKTSVAMRKLGIAPSTLISPRYESYPSRGRDRGNRGRGRSSFAHKSRGSFTPVSYDSGGSYGSGQGSDYGAGGYSRPYRGNSQHRSRGQSRGRDRGRGRRRGRGRAGFQSYGKGPEQTQN